MRKKLQKFNCQRTKKNPFDVFIQRYNEPPGLEFRPQPAAWRLKEGRKSYAGIDPISSMLSFQSSRTIVQQPHTGGEDIQKKWVGKRI
jgi:hypothetical protein